MRHAVLSGTTTIAFATSISARLTTSTFLPSYYHHPGGVTLAPSKIVITKMGSSSVPSAPSPSPPTTTTEEGAPLLRMGNDDDRDRLPSGILAKIEKFATPRGDALFGYVERCHADRDRRPPSSRRSENGDDRPSFGDVLDAGTGSHSLRWMASVLHRDRLLGSIREGGQGRGGASSDDASSSSSSSSSVVVDSSPRVTMGSYTAVTADEAMRRRVYDEAVELGVGGMGDVVIGNWVDETLLGGRTYDTILADYLVGAIDGFSPHFQDRVFPRLARHLAPGGRMYVIGLQPVPDRVVGGGDGDVFCRITKVRDACILLAGQRCYREYPMDWIIRHLESSGLDVVDTRTYPIRYDHGTMVRQINVGRSKLKSFQTKGMAREMGHVLDGLEKESLEVTRRSKDGRITLGFDYVVVAEKPMEEEEEEEEGRSTK